MVLGVEHRLAEVGDRSHEHPRIGVLGRGVPVGPRPAASLHGRLCRTIRTVGAVRHGLAGRRDVQVECHGGLDDRLPARETAQAHEGTLARGDRAAGGREEVGESEPAMGFDHSLGQLEGSRRLEFRRQPLAVIGRSRGQGGFGEVDRAAPAGPRPIRAAPLPQGREQVDEARIDVSPLPSITSASNGTVMSLLTPTASITPRRTTMTPGSNVLPGAATILASLIA